MKLKHLVFFVFLMTVLYGLSDTPVPLNVWRTNGVVASPTNFWRSNVIAGTGIQLTPTSSNITVAVDTSVVSTNAVTYDPTTFDVSPTNLNRFSATNILFGHVSGAIFATNAMGGGVFTNSTDSSIRVAGASIGSGQFADTTNANVTAFNAGIAQGSFTDGSHNSYSGAQEASWVGARFEGSTNSRVVAYDGAFGGALFTESPNCTVDYTTGSGSVELYQSKGIIGSDRGSWSSLISFNSTNIFPTTEEGGLSTIYLEFAHGAQPTIRRGSLGALYYFQATNGIAWIEKGSAGFGVFMADNERLFSGPVDGQAPAVGSFVAGRDIAATNAWAFGIHGTNSTPFSLALLNNGTKFLVESNGTITSDSLTASTVLAANSSKKISSIANGTGALTNNGSGTLGYYDLTLLAPATGGAYIATNNGTGFTTTFYGQTNSGSITFTNGGRIEHLSSTTVRFTNAIWEFSPGINFPVNSGGLSAGVGFASLGANDLSVYTTGTRVGAYSGNDFYLLGATPILSLTSDTAPQVTFGANQETILTRSGLGTVKVITNLVVQGQLTVGGGLTFSRFATNANVSMTTNFYVWAVTSVAVIVTNTLPSASTSQGIHFIIKDEGGNAAATNITIAVQSGDAIDSATTATLSANFAAKRLYSAGSTNWFTY